MSKDLESSLKSLAWLHQASQSNQKSSPDVTLFFLSQKEAPPASFMKLVPSFVQKRINDKTMEFWQNEKGSFYLVRGQSEQDSQSEDPSHLSQPQSIKTKENDQKAESFHHFQNHQGLFNPSCYAVARDRVGLCFHQVLKKSPSSLKVKYIGSNPEEFKGLCVGLDLAWYRFKNIWPKTKTSKIEVSLESGLKNQSDLVRRACHLSESVNLARFLVDSPANLLQPRVYAHLLKSHLGSFKNSNVQIWNPERLQKEGMGLHLAVGQGSEDGSHLVHLSYQGGGTKPAIAFIGKGITFDSGGLDIKTASGMRLMKKDLGGSASLAGLALFVVQSQLPLNCDFYFAIAENGIGKTSFHPGDILTSRSGKTVEIHNTDAEGRLVMADALSLAAEKKPSRIIDVATLTGAIKYGLGVSAAGLFSNEDTLARDLLVSSHAAGETCWRMPLLPAEAPRLKSDVADTLNSTDGYGGAITAALFLEKFVDSIPWAHFDIYAWTTKAQGPFATSGGTGQMVQTLIHYLQQQALK